MLNFWSLTIGDIIAISLVPLSLLTGYYLRKWFKSPIQKTQEANQKVAYYSLFKSIENFDNAFKYFYNTFEGFFIDIRLLQRNFLPLSTTMKVTITGKEGTTEKDITLKFENFLEDDMSWTFDVMISEHENLEKILKSTASSLIDIKIQSLLMNYTNTTIKYMKHFQEGHNTNSYLSIRLDDAQNIINEIKNQKLIDLHPYLKNFVDKWQRYISQNKYNHPEKFTNLDSVLRNNSGIIWKSHP